MFLRLLSFSFFACLLVLLSSLFWLLLIATFSHHSVAVSKQHKLKIMNKPLSRFELSSFFFFFQHEAHLERHSELTSSFHSREDRTLVYNEQLSVLGPFWNNSKF